MTSLQTRVTPGKGVSFEIVAGEAVLLNIHSGKYYGLDEVGTRFWSLLTELQDVEPVYQALLSEYDVSEEQLQHDLFTLIDDLVCHGLLRFA